MTREAFERLVTEEFPRAVPEKFQHLVDNVAFIVEDAPSHELRQEEGLGPSETLLGHYRGIPTGARGSGYGVGGTLPDTITLFQLPIEEAARDMGEGEEFVRTVVRDTIWHEIGHHFGLDEWEVRSRERNRRSI